MTGPKPTETHPMKGFHQVCYLKNVIKNPNIIVGDYTYYDDPGGWQVKSNCNLNLCGPAFAFSSVEAGAI